MRLKPLASPSDPPDIFLVMPLHVGSLPKTKVVASWPKVSFPDNQWAFAENPQNAGVSGRVGSLCNDDPPPLNIIGGVHKHFSSSTADDEWRS